MAIAKEKFLKGQKLLSLAKQKANQIGLSSEGLKLEDLIRKLQEMEGFTACFRVKKSCPEMSCCWQASCGCKMLAS
jgi:hypothetical protein